MKESGNLPKAFIQHLWQEMAEASYLAMMEGFSRITYCSTEGRSLMSMDLAGLASGMSPSNVSERLEDHASVDKPPSVVLARGRTYVDTFIKIFYFPPEVSF